MPQHNLSISPYFDDYNEQKGFAKILFKPGVGVQTRELNQLQSLLQKQVSRIGDHLFKQGSMIIPGGTTYDLNVRSLKIASTYNSNIVDYNALIGRTLTCQSSGCQFQVITTYVDTSNTAIKVLIVALVAAGGTNSDVTTPTAGETLVDNITLANVATVDTVAGYYSKASIAHVDNGVFYVEGYFVQVLAQTLVLDPYGNTPTAKVGLNVVESIITEVDDTSLLDPAFGSSNENAPGAHRLKIELVFAKVDLNTAVSDSFIELMDFVNGQIVFQQNKTEYAEVMKTLARRTFEEAGNYTVKNFVPTLREHLLSADGKNGGVYTALQGGDASKFVLQLTPGVAFVNGYETSTTVDTLLAIQKSRDTVEVLNDVLRPSTGNYFMIGNMVGVPDIAARPFVELRNNSSVGTNPSTYTVIGYGVVDNLDYYSGTIGSSTEILKARVSQIKLTAGGIVRSIGIANGGTGYGAAPAVTITGDGVGATATAVVTSGAVTQINITANGTGYTYANVSIAAPTTGVTAQGFALLYYYNIEDVGSIAQVNLGGTNPFTADVLTEYTISGVNGTITAGMTFTDVDNTAKAKVHSWNSVSKLMYGAKTGNTIADEILSTGMLISNGVGITGTVVDKILLKEPAKNDLIFDIPYYPVKTLFSTSNITDIEYTVNREYSILLDGSGLGSIVAGASESIAPFSSADFTAMITASTTPANIGMIDLTNYINSTNPLSYALNLGVAHAGDTLKVIVPIRKLSAAYRTKTMVSNFEYVIPAAKISKYNSLLKSDVFRLVGVWQKNNVAAINTYADIQANPSYYRDIKYQFTLNDGQRDSYITHGSITLNTGNAIPTNDIVIVFDYFTSGAGEFFCVDSYSGVTSYLDLNPTYKSVSSNISHKLYSAVDFRPVALANVNEFSCNIVNGTATVILDGSDGQSTNALTVGQSVIGQGIPVGTTVASITDTTTFVLSAFATRTANKVVLVIGGYDGTTYLTKFKECIDYGQSNIKSNTDFKTHLQYYVPRIDSVYVTASSNFEWIKGNPAANPKADDKSSETKMKLFDLYIPAYTFDINLITLQKKDNQGYTMQKIAGLENRLSNLEQFTTLTLLEKQTKDLTIIDPATGLNRMKLGFGMDGFKDNSLADLNDSEYHAAMDYPTGTCSAPILINQIELVNSASSANVSLVGSHAVANGAVSNPTIAMLPYTEVTLASQNLASEARNVNPFSSYTWYGKMKITPEVNVWTDTRVAPAVIVARNFSF